MAPRTPVELLLAGLWSEVLGIESVGVRDSFFALGGHSLLAVRLMARIRQRFGRELPLAILFRASTIERLAALLQAGSGPAGRRSLVELTPAGSGARRRPFFCVHPAGGNVLCYADLAQAMGSDQPFFGLQLPDLETLGPDPTIETLAARYLAALAAVAPAGPYALGGWSLGGAIAYEMARQLEAAGETVAPLVLIDPSAPARRAALPAAPAEPPVAAEAAAPAASAAAEALLKATFVHDLLALSGRGQAAPAEALRRLDLALPVGRLAAAAQAAGLMPAELDPEDVVLLYELFRTTRRALERYRPAPYAGRLTLLLAARHPAASNGRPAAAWASLAGAGAELVSIPGDHYSIMRPPSVDALAKALRRRLVAAG
jgi:thioesterase domain-containing protein/acyl carrier protein